MKKVSRILAVLDPTSSEQPAAKKACQVAAQSGAEVELFICDYDQHLSGERFFDSQGLQRARDHIIERHRTRLGQIADQLRRDVPGAAELQIDVDARWDNPRDDAILRKLRDSKADLLVKDTHYHNVLKRTVFTNTDWELIRGCEARQPPRAPRAGRVRASPRRRGVGDFRPRRALTHSLRDREAPTVRIRRGERRNAVL